MEVSIAATDPLERLERYRRWAQYPPFSRPLHAGQVDLIDPYNAERPEVSVIQEPARGCERTETGGIRCEQPAVMSEFSCRMTPERSISVGRGDFHIYLECLDGQGQRLAIDDLETKMGRRLFGREYGSLPPIHAADDGSEGDAEAGDLLYTIMVRPTAQDWGFLFVEANFEVKGFEHSQRANWYSTPHTVAEFGGSVQDMMRDGHLIVRIPVTVQKAGYYEFEANLQEQGGDERFIASAFWRGDLAAGNQTVEIQFWGKVIRDAHIDGPYVVRDIRAKRNNSPVSPAEALRAREEGRTPTAEMTEPLWEYMEPMAETHVTAAYSSDSFSSAEWQSEDKEQRLRFLEEQVR